MVKIWTVIFLICVASVNFCHAQRTFDYSYTDPCTGSVKKLAVPADGITVNYYGQIKTFNSGDFINGAFESWTEDVFSSFGNNNPCAALVGLPTVVAIAQNTAINFVSVVNSLSSLSDLSSIGDALSSNVSNAQSVPSSGDEKSTPGENKESPDSKEKPSGDQPQNGNNPSSPPSGGSTTGGSGGSTTGGSGGSGGSSEKNPDTQPEPKSEEGGKTNVTGGSVGSVSNSTGSKSSSSSSNKNGNRPSILASSDFVGFNFQNSDAKYGGKVSGGYTSMRWDGARSHGINADYTSALRGPNITGFYAFMKKKRIDLISTSLTIGFEEKKSIYGTFAFGQMWNIGKKKKLKAVYMLTGSYGSVYGEKFIGTAAIAGGMYDFKFTKRLEIKLLALYVYAPYVSYYNDILLKSPNVVLPIVGTNMKITKKFKINLNCGGAWALNESALNYTIMMGTRLLL
jgi:hypothetical protein